MSEEYQPARSLELPGPEELVIHQLGKPTIPSPLLQRNPRFTTEQERVLVPSTPGQAADFLTSRTALPSFEAAGPREKLFFNPRNVSCGIVTCGGLCPGLNDVIRSIVLTLHRGYGARRVLGFRYGYNGLSSQRHREPSFLEPESVEHIHQHGGTILGSSRGPQDLSEIVDTLVKWKIDVLFAVGGDGTLRGASELWQEIERRNLKIAVVGVPKTIDNDLRWIARSFGFATAVSEAQTVIEVAHTEAKAAWNGIGLVKLMGRHAGFIAAEATLTNGDVDFCLVPEVHFTMEGKGGFLEALQHRIEDHHHAVVVAAEGAAQEMITQKEKGRDASGNIKLKDVGLFLRERITAHFASKELAFTIKYIDPSYTIRSLPANSSDSGFCLILGQHAVHAGLAGKTNMMVGFWNQRFTHVPLPLVAGGRKYLDPQGETWQRVLDSTLQPTSMIGQ